MKLPAFCLTFLMALCVNNVYAQESIVKSLQANTPGEGRVTIHQSPEIGALLGSRHLAGEGHDSQVKMSGYRVQVYAGGNSRNSKREAENMEAKVKSLFPELAVYKSFNPPRWLCRIGDFRTIEEADAMMRRLRSSGGFKEVSIVRDQIVIYL